MSASVLFLKAPALLAFWQQRYRRWRVLSDRLPILPQSPGSGFFFSSSHANLHSAFKQNLSVHPSSPSSSIPIPTPPLGISLIAWFPRSENQVFHLLFTQWEAVGLILQPSKVVLANSREGAQHIVECALPFAAWALPNSPVARHRGSCPSTSWWI